MCTVSAQSSKRKKPIWADKQCWTAMKRKQNALRYYQRHRTHEALISYQESSESVKTEVERAVRQFEEKLAANAKYDSKSGIMLTQNAKAARRLVLSAQTG